MPYISRDNRNAICILAKCAQYIVGASTRYVVGTLTKALSGTARCIQELALNMFKQQYMDSLVPKGIVDDHMRIEVDPVNFDFRRLHNDMIPKNIFPPVPNPEKIDCG